MGRRISDLCDTVKFCLLLDCNHSLGIVSCDKQFLTLDLNLLCSCRGIVERIIRIIISSSHDLCRSIKFCLCRIQWELAIPYIESLYMDKGPRRPSSYSFAMFSNIILQQCCDTLYFFFLPQALNIIYLDQPVGTGFSYSTSQEGYDTGDIKSAALTYEFIRKVSIS